MKVAIIGAGFAGLATAHFLLDSGQAEVTIFEASKIGAGASGVCSGLLHPYVGLSVRRSSRAEEALAITKQLIRVAECHTPKLVAIQNGILRKSMNPEQRQRLIQHCDEWGDIEQIDRNLFFIHSGITVLSENYLEGLFASIQKRGGRLLIQKIESLSDLQGYDQIVIAAGYGIKTFPECAHVKVKFLKGQALQMQGVPPLERSFISKGYIANIGSHSQFELGSTYEKEFADPKPNLDVAQKELEDKLRYCKEAKITGCKAGVRVCTIGHYLPIIEQIAPNIHVFTGLGSRGLLYHGLYGRKLVQEILSKNMHIS